MEREAKRILKNHDYVQIGYGDCEVWQCTENGSSFYGFDICISSFGMSIHGDIGNLSFRVGAYGYGLPFLARKGVSGYIFEKLDEAYRKTQIRKGAIKDMVAKQFYSLLEDIVCDPDEIESDLPEDEIGFKIPISENADHLDEMVEFAEKVSSGEIELESKSLEKSLIGLYGAYELFYEIMYENTDVELADRLGITEPDESIMLRLHIVNLAAKNIMKIKDGTHQMFRHMWT